MVKFSSKYICQQCGYESLRWLGKCPGCDSWNSLVETVIEVAKAGKTAKAGKVSELVKLTDIKTSSTSRLSTGISEFDRVLGGGIVSGSVVLLAGEPGIGKSTLLLQLAANVSGWVMGYESGSGNGDRENKKNIPITHPRPITNNSISSQIIYISGEESPSQIKLRAERLGIKDANLLFLNETDVDVIIETLKKWDVRSGKLDNEIRSGKTESQDVSLHSPASNIPLQTSSLVIVDSIQTLSTSDLNGTPGSIGQVRECASRLLNFAKKEGIPVFFVGHVNKEGAIAGPMVLSHLVDTVLMFEGERFQMMRILRSFKNRFGPTDEVGIFSMEEAGLVEVTNPSSLFLAERSEKTPGSIVTALMEGTRSLLVEVQALVTTTQLPIPRRVGNGIDNNRLQLLTAVLTRHAGLSLGNMDIFVNIAGGIKISEPAADLAICLAIASAYLDKAVNSKICAIGEVGLLGEIRNVPQSEKRLKEAQRLGYDLAITAKEAKTLREAIKLASSG